MFGKKPTQNQTSGNDLITQTPMRRSDDVSTSALQKLFAHTVGYPDTARSVEEPIDIRFTDASLQTREYGSVKQQLTEKLLENIDFASLEMLPELIKKDRLKEAASKILYDEISTPFTSAQIELLKNQVVDDLLGFGPIEVLMSDPEISDIMINGHSKIYIEKAGKVLRTDVVFGSEKQLLNVIQKIVAIVGRRIDESSPMVDARMPDGSRFNAIIPPLALNGCLVSIRKFKKHKMPLKEYVTIGSMSEAMYQFLSICGHIGLNIIISGGTGSGKTTLLNAISGSISPKERIVTIEDAAELQLQQPHVLRMETRPPNMEGAGEVTQRQLLRNALRMRPDRIIVGEMRGDEVMDVLSAMNTGHDGSMATIHSNSPADALSRLENLVSMSSVNLSTASLRSQIASAVQLIVQIERQRDGKRRITQIDEIIGMEGANIKLQTLFAFEAAGMGEDGYLKGTFHSMGIKPKFLPRAAYFERDKDLLESMKKS
ncbi:MAG: CpaF family protein [Rickettsiales bacterium]|nr:CpaF family protein [Rickettsiales bacterium]